MSAHPVIRFRDVSKRFTYTAERPHTVLETVIGFARGSWRRGRRDGRRELWAVRDVSFDVQPGESLGIIGRNGSGKSTLMKLAAGILRPTSGAVSVNGRISALLELGAGFHPDLTGRENIFLNGSLLGLSRAAVAARYDDIVDFSELGDYINMPVKHYSSGMYMRLGFSVAIHVDPSVLIVDEILAVGDQAFQNKCLERIFALKRDGVTIVLVTHELGAVRHLCSHLVWMDHGRARAAGPTHEVLAAYLAYSQGIESHQILQRDGQFHRRWGTGDVEITAVRLLDAAGAERRAFQTGEALTVEIAFTAHRAVDEPEFGLAIYRDDGVHVNGPNSRVGGLALGVVEGPGVVRYRVDELPLLPGAYRLTVAVHDSRMPRAFDFHEQAYAFRVVPGATPPEEGLVTLAADWQWAPAAPEGAPAAAQQAAG